MIYLTNTLSKEKEQFIPQNNNKVTIYHCGPTVYWTQHIGNMRAMVCADMVYRTLTLAGYNVDFVRNYTDVGHLTGDNHGDADTGEDRMEKAAKRENLSPDEIADKYIAQFESDTKKLNTFFPKYTRATHHITEMIEMVQTLLEKGFAYTTDLAVYFDISKAENYTQLSGQDISKLVCGSGHGEVNDTQAKKNPGDFSLWFFKAGTHANALQTWQSPFSSPLVENGEGFPGWHIECSAMATAHLGNTLDIHIGGIEHIPIHHTNEIAQSESATGKPFVKYWLHNEHLLVDGEKMSKSAGTSYVISDIEEKGFSALDLRMFFLGAHYRSKQNFTWEALAASKKARQKLQLAYLQTRLKKTTKEPVNETQQQYIKEFSQALFDDINTAKALAVVHTFAKDKNLTLAEKRSLFEFAEKTLQIGITDVKELDGQKIKMKVTIPKEILELAKQRVKAKKEKNYSLADELRTQIEAKGFEVIDTPDGFKISKSL